VADEHAGAPLRTLQIEGFPALTTGELSAWARLDVDGGVLVSVGHPGQDPIAWLAASASDTRLRELSLHSQQTRLTGGKLAYVASIPGGRRVVVRDLDARDRIVFRGPPSLDIRDLAIGDGVVAWSTPTCQLVAAFPTPVIRRLPAGPCPRSEATIRQVGPDSPVLDREATTMRVRCLTADSRACRVRLALRLLGHDYRLPGRLRVRVGGHHDVRIHVAPIVARCIRVIGASIEAISTDANGRRHNRSGAGLGYEPEDSLAYQERRYVVICRAAREHLRSRR
jgi:hypothetical protein